MNLSDLASIGGAISAITLVISLVFLNIQVRQSGQNQRALIQQGRARRTVDIAMSLMNADFAEIYYRCINGDTGISTTQLGQFMGYCRAVFLGSEDSFLQHKESLLDELAFISFMTSLRAIFAAPGGGAMWKMTSDGYEPEFVAFMDIIVTESATLLPVNQLAQWTVLVSNEMSLHEAA